MNWFPDPRVRRRSDLRPARLHPADAHRSRRSPGALPGRPRQAVADFRRPVRDRCNGSSPHPDRAVFPHRVAAGLSGRPVRSRRRHGVVGFAPARCSTCAPFALHPAQSSCGMDTKRCRPEPCCGCSSPALRPVARSKLRYTSARNSRRAIPSSRCRRWRWWRPTRTALPSRRHGPADAYLRQVLLHPGQR